MNVNHSKLIRNELGQGLTEYIVLLILVSVASIGIVQSLGKEIRGRLKVAQEKIGREVSVNSE